RRVRACVIMGRPSGEDGEGRAGVASAGWPSRGGRAAGEAATRAWRRPAAVVPTGVGVWLATVALGQLLRAVSGPGTDAAFIAVSAVFLGLFLIGRRVAPPPFPPGPAPAVGRHSPGRPRPRGPPRGGAPGPARGPRGGRAGSPGWILGLPGRGTPVHR